MNIIDEEKQYLMSTYKRYPLALAKGRGKYVWDARGKRYLDFFAGISVCNLGHCDPKVVAAVKKQAAALLHVSNLYYTEPQVRLAKALVKASFPGKVFFSNSGAEANECAIKLARKWGTGRYEIVTFSDSFHGRTITTLAATGQEKFHKGYEPLTEGFVFAKFNDLASAQNAMTQKTAAIMVEPVQGEGGVNVATPAFLKGLRKLCDDHNLLLMFDEVQSGMGRTGKLFAFENYPVVPDVVTLAKSLGGGLPIGATIAGEKAAGVFSYSDHGSTFGGNLVSCAAASAVLGRMNAALFSKVQKTGRYFMGQLNSLKSRFPVIKEVRGMGLMVGAELAVPGRDIVEYCLKKGLLINCTQDTVLRFLPPLIIDRKDVDTALHILEEALQWQTSRK